MYDVDIEEVVESFSDEEIGLIVSVARDGSNEGYFSDGSGILSERQKEVISLAAGFDESTYIMTNPDTYALIITVGECANEGYLDDDNDVLSGRQKDMIEECLVAYYNHMGYDNDPDSMHAEADAS